MGKKLHPGVLPKLLLKANLEAATLGAAHCGSEVVLLVLIEQQQSLAGEELRRNGLELDAMRVAVKELFSCAHSRVERINQAMFPGKLGSAGPPRSANFQRILSLSEEVALQLGAEQIEYEHVLLATLKIESSGATTLLEYFGIDRVALYQELLRSMGE